MMNTIPNITASFRNNIFKVKASWLNYVTKVTYTYTTTITIPDGYYPITSLLAYLDTQLLITDESGNLLSPTGNSLPGFIFSTYSKLQLSCFPTALTQTNVPLATNTHVYTSFEYVIDNDTIHLMKLLGFVENKEIITATTTNNVDYIFTCTPIVAESSASTYYQVTTTNSLYTVNSTYSKTSGDVTTTTAYVGYVAPNMFNLQVVESIYICVENLVSLNRASYDNLNTTDYLFQIPVISPYGNVIYINSIIDRKVSHVNCNFNNLNILLLDQNGDPIDLQGLNYDMTLQFSFGVNIDDVDSGFNANDMSLSKAPIRPIDPDRIMDTYGESRDYLNPNRIPTRKRKK